MTNSGYFRHLHEKRYTADSFETGHLGYDGFLADALRWKGSLAELEAAGWGDRSVLEREVPFLVRFEEEPAESLGRAMLINIYCMPQNSIGWIGQEPELWRMPSFCQLFTDFTRTLQHARISADDAVAILTEIPDSLVRDRIEVFEELFLKSFPTDAPEPLRAALGNFLGNFFEADIFWYAEPEPIIARHERLWTYLGRNPLDLEFYRERERVFDLSRAQAARFTAQLGPIHVRIAEADVPWTVRQSDSFRAGFRAELEASTPAARGQIIADSCRAFLKRATSTDVERWVGAGAPFAPSKLTMLHEDLIAPLRLPMELSQDQACKILEYMTRHGDRFASNYPALDYQLSAKLARYLPVGRADLERLVKDTDYQTDQAVKDILLDALRGKKRGPLDRLLRRFVPWIYKPKDRPELWAEWIDAKRELILAQADSRVRFGVAAPNSASVADWSRIGGQAYDLDVVGYAKRVALAQSYGTDILLWLNDLRRLAEMIRTNLETLEALPAPSSESLSSRTTDRLIDGPDSHLAHPSLYGLWSAPTAEQLVQCERTTLAALDKLIARIELCERHQNLAPFEQRMRYLTRGQDFGGFHLTLFAHSIEQATSSGIPDGFMERLAAFDFALLGGPYIEDTEPCFTEYEVEAWRSSIQALAALPEAISGPKLEAVAQTVFAPELDADRRDYTFAPRGYRQDMLAEAVIRTLVAMPWHTGIPTLMRLQERAQTERLRKQFGEAVQRIKYKNERLS